MKMSDIYHGGHFLYRKNARSKTPGPAFRVRVVGTHRTITTAKGTTQPRGVEVEFLNLDGTYTSPSEVRVVPSDDVVELWSYFEARNKDAVEKAIAERAEKSDREKRVQTIKDRLASIGMTAHGVHGYDFSFTLAGDDVEKLLNMIDDGKPVTEFVFKPKGQS